MQPTQQLPQHELSSDSGIWVGSTPTDAETEPLSGQMFVEWYHAVYTENAADDGWKVLHEVKEKSHLQYELFHAKIKQLNLLQQIQSKSCETSLVKNEPFNYSSLVTYMFWWNRIEHKPLKMRKMLEKQKKKKTW